ncbi:MAG: class I SAM-dependent methyltransferase [Microthrixaceae bacterium]|nr:class I SAM-dependent methyltransferase [Microthrixaceae bacterium]
MPDNRDELSRIYQGYAEKNQATGRWSRSNPGNEFILNERERLLVDLLAANGVTGGAALAALDVGCGSSTLLPPTLHLGARFGVDILFERLIPAVETGSLAGVACADGAMLPFPDSSFELVVLSTVLSSVPDADVRARIGSDVTRVLRDGGHVLWYDMRVPNPANRNITGINRREIARIFPDLDLDTQSATLVPQLARRLGDRPRLYSTLSSLRFTRSHLVGVFTKPDHTRVP